MRHLVLTHTRSLEGRMENVSKLYCADNKQAAELSALLSAIKDRDAIPAIEMYNSANQKIVASYSDIVELEKALRGKRT